MSCWSGSGDVGSASKGDGIQFSPTDVPKEALPAPPGLAQSDPGPSRRKWAVRAEKEVIDESRTSFAKATEPKGKMVDLGPTNHESPGR